MPLSVGASTELGKQTGLADARLAHERDSCRVPAV